MRFQIIVNTFLIRHTWRLDLNILPPKALKKEDTKDKMICKPSNLHDIYFVDDKNMDFHEISNHSYYIFN